MKIFSAEQVKKWDAFTISSEPITSIDLMERAATKCYKWLIKNNFGEKEFQIFCGKGNNGGDGLAIARLLIQNNCRVAVYILEFGKAGTEDFQTNLERLHMLSTNIHFVQTPDFFPVIDKNAIVIDALFGTGLNKPLTGLCAQLVAHINDSGANIISIDLPSGLFADRSSRDNMVIKATHTLSFQNFKLAFLLPENKSFSGSVHILDIGLSETFEKKEPADYELIDQTVVKQIYKSRNAFAHKGDFGHAALLSGSLGMMGAAVLSATACLRSGAGKLTIYVPKCGYAVLQAAVPEAMCYVAGEDIILSASGIENFDAVGIGPGIGLHPSHKDLLTEIFKKTKSPLIIDADALNIIAENPFLLKLIPVGSIFTPHPKEFERLFGKSENNFKRLILTLEKSKELNIYIVLKGHYSFISTPEGLGYFNSTGNPGMATAGSGDVLTGILTGLVAQGYTPLNACLLGVYLHGLAGDIASELFSENATISRDIVESLGIAFKKIQSA